MASEQHSARERTAPATSGQGAAAGQGKDKARARKLDQMLDEALEETFPASDPVAIHIDRPAPDPKAGR